MGEAMHEVCRIPGGVPYCKLHGLRMLAPAIFGRLPLASADSTYAARSSSLIPRYGSYPPLTSAGRMAVIADRIEAHNSAATWAEPTETGDLFSWVADE